MLHCIDLSHTLWERTTMYPGCPAPRIETVARVEEEGYAESYWHLYSHTGTHIDAPRHVIAGGAALDAFAPERFMGEAWVVDCRRYAGQSIPLEYLQGYARHLEHCAFVLLHTGWDTYWAQPELYFGDYPVLSLQAALWLSRLPMLRGIGLDCPSIDRIDAEGLPNHHIVLEREILVVENLRGLELLPARAVQFQCLPLPVAGADGSPVRALALWEDA